jgi:hypothetical protein
MVMKGGKMLEKMKKQSTQGITEKSILNINCVFCFSPQLLFETYFALVNI